MVTEGNDEEKVYSLNEDGEFVSYGEMIEILKEEYKPGVHTVHAGTVEHVCHGDFIDCDDIIDLVSERAYDEFAEIAEDYLQAVPDKKVTELENVISEWLNANTDEINFKRIIISGTVKISTEI